MAFANGIPHPTQAGAGVIDQDQWTAIDPYTNSLLIPEDPVLAVASEVSRDAGLPDIEVAPDQGMLLHLLARVRGARAILEIGVRRLQHHLAGARPAAGWQAHHH
ncbi:hypothetical protein [Streptomyces sp. NPDC053560]|uniref:hypothetical protein n=1 Tax=Streptomyces sp. NPDC053560 TaxID=3365711 RepID=UPI0037D866C2